MKYLKIIVMYIPFRFDKINLKKYLHIIFILSFIVFNYCSKNNVNVTIEVTPNKLSDVSAIYITGNDDQLGNWQADSIRLDKFENGKWSKEFSFEKGKKIEFKITRGSWETEALNPDSSIPSNYTFEVFNDTTIEIKVNLWADQTERKVEGQITGMVNYYRNFQGEGIKPRDVIVWMPPGYKTELNKKYPVLYMHDGQNVFDPKTSTFNIDWQLDENADSLIRKRLIQSIIIVAIYNTPDRDYEYDEVSLGQAYMNFIVDSLKPFIDRNYRTKTDRENTANGGASLGGLISFILVWEHSDVFSKALCFSPAFKIDNYDYVDNVTAYNGKMKNIEVYINNGDNELDSSLQPGVDEMINALVLKGYIDGRDFYYYKAKNSLHGERDWAKNVWRGLIYLFGTEKGKALL